MSPNTKCPVSMFKLCIIKTEEGKLQSLSAFVITQISPEELLPVVTLFQPVTGFSYVLSHGTCDLMSGMQEKG